MSAETISFTQRERFARRVQYNATSLSAAPPSRGSSNKRRSLQVTTALLAMIATAVPANPAAAQGIPTPATTVSVCSGVSLPPSVVTGIIDPVVTGIYDPIETNINQTLGALGLLLGLPSPLSVDVSGLLSTAASGSDIGLNVLSIDGTVVGPSDQCDASADSFTLDNPAGVSIGGNQITGLGDPGEQAVAGEIDSIAIGNRASTDATATSSIAIGTDATIDVGAVNSVALGSGATATSLNSVALGAGSVADRDNSISVGAVGSERVIANVAPGTLGTDAVNLDQLNAVQALIPTDAVEYDDATHTTITLDGAGGTTITNVAAGAVNPTSTDAVNGAQLDAVQTQVDTNTTDIANLQTQVDGIQTQVDSNTTDIANLQVQVDGNTTDISNLQVQVDGNTTDITNLQTEVAGNTTTINNIQTQVDTNTTDISNLTVQVGDNTTNIANNNTAITNLTLAVTNGAVGPVQYSDAATPTVPNGGTPSNDVTLVGAAPGAVAVHNVAEGVIASGSTDAVNGGQIYDLFAALPDSVADAVIYDDDTHTSVTFNNGGDSTVLHNVAAGVAPTDAVNVGQMNGAINTAMNSAVSIANAYTDARFEALDFDLRKARHDARSGTAAALAAAGMPQAMGEGKTMIAGGVGAYRGKVGIAMGASYRADNGKSVYKVGLTYDSSQHVGANAGAGFEF